MKLWIIEPEETTMVVLLKEQIARTAQGKGVEPPPVTMDRLREEKRLYARIPCFLLVDYAAKGCAHRAFVRNISADGAFIESQRPVSPGPRVSLIISLPNDQRPIKTTGDIVWVGEQGIGVKFKPVKDLLSDWLPS